MLKGHRNGVLVDLENAMKYLGGSAVFDCEGEEGIALVYVGLYRRQWVSNTNEGSR